ncbi:hypothetical protein GIB67_017607 [Kingdonia uniflora]|uniref:BZIP domain-containing protein n=1 Tax=Kingdonia uniflora TaxID=39325 RepID=A0A7J7LN61_9MAGN|nr:hypothetical protein GIB67_017607 [Kingdonia uniflora]
MGSNINFKNIGDFQSDGGGRPPGNFSLARQPSVYSLTFEEFQNQIGGCGKDFGSMNMDEFLKNIWTAEEAQVMGGASSSFNVGNEGGMLPTGGNLQRQGSLTLPRTLSTKTVDEVWRDVFKDGTITVTGAQNLPQRQPTFGEITLEEFLVKAGVVREDTQTAQRPINTGFYVNTNTTTTTNNNNPGMSLGFGHSDTSPTNRIMVNRVNNQPTTQSLVNGVRTNQQQQQQTFFQKHPNAGYTSSLHLANAMGIVDPTMQNGLIQGGVIQGGGMGVIGLGGGVGPVSVATESPANQLSDGLALGNGDTSSLSPVPYILNGGLRGKRGGAVEKVVERRQRRMIKNRESAARSRARKQAYTMELEAEVAKLKEEKEELKKEQEKLLKLQKNQARVPNFIDLPLF